MAQNPYSIRGGEVGRSRLRLLSEVMREGTDPMLDRFCMPGMRCLDLGSGGGDVATSMAACVGDNGSVLGVDLDAAKVAMATAEAHALGLMNVACRSIADDSTTLMCGPTIFQAWGRIVRDA